MRQTKFLLQSQIQWHRTACLLRVKDSVARVAVSI